MLGGKFAERRVVSFPAFWITLAGEAETAKDIFNFCCFLKAFEFGEKRVLKLAGVSLWWLHASAFYRLG